MNDPTRDTERDPLREYAPCPECGRDSADTSMPKPAWNSWRRVLPLSLLTLACLVTLVLSVPDWRYRLTGVGKEYRNTWHSNEPARVWNLSPQDLTPPTLAQIAAGTAPTDPLRALLDDAAAHPDHFGRTADPLPEVMVCTVELAGSHAVTWSHGFPIPFLGGNARVDFDSVEDLHRTESTDIETAWSADLFGFNYYWGSSDDRSGTVLYASWFTLFAIAGVLWFVYVLAGVFTKSRGARWFAVGVVALLFACSAMLRVEEPIYTFNNDNSIAFFPTGLTHAELVGARSSEGSLRKLAAKLSTALGPDTDPAQLVYLGARAPCDQESYDSLIGPPYLSFGVFSNWTGVHHDEAGERDETRPVKWASLPLVRSRLGRPWWNVRLGDHLFTFETWTANLVTVPTLLALIYSIPRWAFGFVARRTHKRRVRLGQCVGCGYDLHRAEPTEAVTP